MKFSMRLRVKRAERSLERVLGLVARRQYELDSVCAHSGDNDVFMEIDLSVVSERPGEVLLRQLAKLHDVERVELHHLPSEAADSAGSAEPCLHLRREGIKK